MIILFILFVFVFYIYQKYRRYTGFSPLFSIVFPTILYLLFLIEVEFSSISYFVSDELTYANNLRPVTYQLDRLFWYALNKFLLNIDVFGTVAVKIISIPVLFLTLYMLWSIYFKDKRIFLVVLVLPYISYLATKDLRDIFILFFTVSVYYTFYKLKRKWLVVLPIMFLFLIRPFIAFIAIGLIIYDFSIKRYISISVVKMRFIIKTKIFKYILSVIILIVLFISIPYINKRINSYWNYFNYYTSGNGYQERLELREGLSTGYKFLDYSYGAVRYVFTPLPTSLLVRIFHGGYSGWGLLDDLIRMLNQFLYYILLLYSILNLKYIYKRFKLCSSEVRLFVLTMLMYLPVYTFYGFGVGHQRIKIPFQLGIFLLYIINKNVKLNK